MAAAKEKKATTEKTKKVKKVKAATTEATTAAKTQKFKEYTICTKRSGRYEVLAANGKNVNGLDKAKVLVEAKLIKTGLSKAPPKEVKEEAPPAA